MSLLSGFDIPFSESQNCHIVLKDIKDLTVTILLGENGTRKSLILRNILEDALIAQSPTTLKLSRERSSFFNVPAQVVAISAVPTDRFPSKPIGNERRGGKYDVPNYRYLGPRTAKNIISRNQSIYEFTLALLTNQNKFSERSSFISTLADKTAIPLSCVIRLDPFIRPGRLAGNDLIGILKESEGYSEIQKNNRTTPWLIELLKRKEVEKCITDLKERIISNKNLTGGSSLRREDSGWQFSIYVDFKTGQIDTRGGTPEELYIGLVFGILKSRKVDFMNVRSLDFINQVASAGQWSLFSSLASLSLVAEDQTLVLVDEPENTLHPKWQREYLDDVIQCLKGYKNCHVVLATHAPLIASSLRHGKDQLVRLRDVQGQVEGELLDTPDGWTANDILEDVFELRSTRSTDLVELIDNALGIIGKGTKGREIELHKTAKNLREYLSSLPEDDIARNIIGSILKVASEIKMPTAAKKVVRQK